MENKMKCPFLKMKPCLKDECALYVRVTGTEKNEGEKLVNKGGCAIAYGPVIGIEGNQMVREHGGATESLRNEIAKANKVNQILVGNIGQLIGTLGQMAQRSISK